MQDSRDRAGNRLQPDRLRVLLTDRPIIKKGPIDRGSDKPQVR